MNISMVPLNILRSVRTMRVGNESSSEPIFYPIMHSGPPEKVHSQSRNQEILHQIFVNGGPTVSNAPRTRRSCFEADFFFLCPHRDLIVAKSWLLTFRDWSIYFCAIFADRIDTWSCHRRRPCLFCPSSESYWGTPVKAWRSPRIVIHWLDTKMRVIARFAERKSEGFNKADDLTAQLSGLPAHLAVGAPATQMESWWQLSSVATLLTLLLEHLPLKWKEACEKNVATNNISESMVFRFIQVPQIIYVSGLQKAAHTNAKQAWNLFVPGSGHKAFVFLNLHWTLEDFGKAVLPCSARPPLPDQATKRANQKRHTVCWNLCFRQQKHHHKLIKVSEKYV